MKSFDQIINEVCNNDTKVNKLGPVDKNVRGLDFR